MGKMAAAGFLFILAAIKRIRTERFQEKRDGDIFHG
jgi:hypothetical protein